MHTKLAHTVFPCNISVKPIANLTKPNGNKPIYGGTKSRLTNANFIATVSQKAVKYFNVKSLQFTLPIIRVNQNWRTISESRGLLSFSGVNCFAILYRHVKMHFQRS